MRAKQTDQMRDPHARGETFATDVAKRKDQTLARLFDTEKISRQMTNCKDLTRHIERTMTHKTRRTQSPMHLRRFEDRSVQFCIISLECFESGVVRDT
jgi:16S rRNA C1402 (ribose-2'-O) methylase RsmI